MRQVRLDDDVVALVAAFQETEGLPSLASSANRMLRLAAGPDDAEPVVERDVVAFPAPRRRPRQARLGILSQRHAPTITANPLPAGDVLEVRATIARHGCEHPALARRGNRCAACGASLPD